MFIELVDALRCPNQHEESWMVASASIMEARHIVSGTLGCPVCAAEFPIERGVVDFRSARRDPPATEGSAAEPYALAALLDLRDAQGFAVLLGAWGSLAGELTQLVETPLMLVDPPASITGSPGISVIRTDGGISLASGVARAIAIDADSAGRLADAIRCTRTGGRVVAPASLSLPAGVRRLAGDDALQVAEREPAAAPLVALHVRRG